MLCPTTPQNSGKDLVFPRVAHHAHEGCGSLRRVIVMGVIAQQVHKCKTQRKEVSEDWCGKEGLMAEVVPEWLSI